MLRELSGFCVHVRVLVYTVIMYIRKFCDLNIYHVLVRKLMLHQKVLLELTVYVGASARNVPEITMGRGGGSTTVDIAFIVLIRSGSPCNFSAPLHFVNLCICTLLESCQRAAGVVINQRNSFIRTITTYSKR
jgi:hypothetical protein